MFKTKIYNKVLINYGLELKKLFPTMKVYLNNDELYIKAKENDLIKLIKFLKNHTNSQYKVLVDICAIDYPEKKFRFEIIYHLISLHYNSRININIFLEDSIPISSITSIYKNANWLEREIWDLFGIFFYNHQDLRRILTDYGFKGHPLRKDFPLSGFIETLYDDFDKKIDYQEVSLSQIYRNFTIYHQYNILK